MIDSMTHEPIAVSTEGDAGPYIVVPIDQLAQVVNLLDRRGVRYWVDSDAVSLNGRPAVAFVNLGRGTDVTLVQGLLDGVR